MNATKNKWFITVLFVFCLIQTQAQNIKLKDQNTKKKVQDKSITASEKLNVGRNGIPNRISMNVTVPKQTQGATFGEKVNAGLHAAGGRTIEDVKLLGIIVGCITWNSESIGSATNAVSSVGNLTGSGGGAESASYAATGMVINPNTHGVVSVILAREAGSGMATGRRQYQPVFNDVQGSTCSDCPVSITTNPYFVDNSMAGEMKMNANSHDQDCDGRAEDDGIGGITVSLVDATSGAILSSTKTTSCGDFYFENLPQNSYVITVFGAWLSKKGYELTITKDGTFDVAGELLSGNNQWAIKINTGLVESNNGQEKVNAGLHAAGSAVASGASLLGGAIPGGTIISTAVSMYSPGDPIPGLDVKLGKKSGNENISIATTNKNGEFEFTNLKKGNYTLTSTLNFYVDGSIPVTIGDLDDDGKAELSKKGYDYYKASSVLNSKETERKGIKENGIKKNEVENTSTAKGKKGLNAVNVKLAKTDVEKTNTEAMITATKSIQEIKNSIDDLEKLLNDDDSQLLATADILTNINNVRNRINELENSLQRMELLGKTSATLADLDTKLSEMNHEFDFLLENLDQFGDQYASISNVLKTKHDTAKNSVGNIR